ncbi:carbamate kinase-like protein [Rhizopus microsporus var. microsporus]|uniref:Isopentenyl phosphate kinase n=2 Tax=Rhizopus microsporus TaxID=58291 RepID=A0A2G4SWK7_RHIZD|nr:carbamate kinase-like protein [Rhizopus microsporus ATCC 52813]ORE01486.1 carbamate kinase-like protein [Rhizopus microsporus var. microsporus]PHZ13159.1 carbamate kinase-like protein [Rhizopus microsporus ATCC 52813]
MIVAVKLGGAAITNKKNVCEYGQSLNNLLDQVEQAYRVLQAQGHQLILIHGAGSFGHPQAKQYQLKAGWETSLPDDNYRKGFSHIRACLQQLNTTIITKLEERDVPVLAITPIDYITTWDGAEETPTERFSQGLVTRTKQYLDLGFVPVLHGDAVLDEMRGCTILSGDVILYHLSKCLPIARCIFVTDVDGIYKADPKLKQEPESFEIVPRIQVTKELQNIETAQLAVADVTGGMQGKIKWAKKIVLDCRTDVVICRAGTKEVITMMTMQDTFTNKMTLFTLF